MDSRITSSARPDIVMAESAPRPTPTPARVDFGQVLAAGASTLVQGAELAASKLPGSPITATAVRGGASTTQSQLTTLGGVSVNAAAEGPGGVPSSTTGVSVGGMSIGIAPPTGGGSSAVPPASDGSGSIDASLQQSAQMNLYYLQVQQEVDSQNRTYTAVSNVMKAEHDSAKAAIGNIHS